MSDFGAQLTQWVNGFLLPLLTTWGVRALGGIAVFVVGVILARSVRRGLVRVFDRTEMDETLEKFLTSLFYYVILTMAGVAALSMMGIQMASVLTILGAAGLAVGLALQGTLSNVAAGVMLLIFRPFRVRDLVEVTGTLGTVKEIGIFATQVNTLDNVRVIISTGTVYNEKISTTRLMRSGVWT